jgi:hypothetical protein
LVVAALVGVLWAFATYGLGALLARALGRGPVEPVPRPQRAER